MPEQVRLQRIVLVLRERRSTKCVEALRAVDGLPHLEEVVGRHRGAAHVEAFREQRQQSWFVPDLQLKAMSEARHQIPFEGMPIRPRQSVHHQNHLARYSGIGAGRNGILARQMTHQSFIGVPVLHFDEVRRLS